MAVGACESGCWIVDIRWGTNLSSLDELAIRLWLDTTAGVIDEDLWQRVNSWHMISVLVELFIERGVHPDSPVIQFLNTYLDTHAVLSYSLQLRDDWLALVPLE